MKRIVSVLVACLLPAGLCSAGPRPADIRLLPQSLTLENARDARRLLVSVRTPDGFWADATAQARFASPDGLVARDADGHFRGRKVGRGSLHVTVDGTTVTLPVVVKSTANPPVSFVRDVMPVLSRTGCNAGTCHGSAKGKNGFKLSLRGYDPDYDYHALISDVAGRRFNRARPAESLMLTKPTQGVAHQGGLVFEENSRYYPILYRWIADGVKSDAATVKRANRIEVLPPAPKMRLPGETQQLLVIAHYPDGSTRDVTRDAVFTSTMPDTAAVTAAGRVQSVRRGEAAILVRYEGNYAANSITVLGDRSGFAWAPQPQLNYIDRLVDAKLQSIKANPSGLATDAEFARRVYLDITGVPPSVEEIRAFLSDKTPSRTKRSALIDKLLDSPDYVEFWTNKWSDLLSVNRKFLGERGVWKFRNWIHTQIAENRPYNAFVRDILTAGGSTFEHPEASYFRVARDPSVATENITQLFLGIRFSCNKCHDHPFERWTQSQYYQFAANFGRVGQKTASTPGDETIFEREAGEVTHPKSGSVMHAGFPYSIGEKPAAGRTRRETLANWLTSAKNPYFAASWVNRVWSYFLGKGIIDPVDDIRSSNPPVNPALLSALTEDFVRSGFDTKHLIRTICNSRTYQASHKTNRWNADDSTNFSHALPRRLSAEQLVDAVARATGSVQRYPGVPSGFRAVQLPDTTVAAGGFLDLFGRPARESPCECERSSTVSLGQALNLVNGDLIAKALTDPAGRIESLIRSDAGVDNIINDLFLAALSRYPTATELKKSRTLFDLSASAVKARQQQDPAKHFSDTEIIQQLKREGAQDLLWSLLNLPAFLFNR
jgi:hypothetical protein